MNHKNIRDIAAYYGAPCTPFDQVDGDTLLKLHNYSGAFSLRLRSLHDLTDGELQIVFSLESIQAAPASITRSAFGPLVGDLFLADSGAFVRRKQGGFLGQPGKVIGYLQSVGVYVPGTIDPKYVEVI